MADLGYVKAQLNRVEDRNMHAALDAIFTHLLQNLRLGVPEHQTRATNMQLYWMQSTTASDTGEFSIAHGLPGTPHYAIPVLELDRPGAQVVQLEVTRAADMRRIYLKSSSPGVPITLLTEG